MPIFTSPPLPEPAREGERRNRKEGAQKSLRNVKKHQKASKSISDTQQRESFSFTVAHILLPKSKREKNSRHSSLSLSLVWRNRGRWTVRITHALSLAATLAHKKIVRVCVPILRGGTPQAARKKAMLLAFPPLPSSAIFSRPKKMLTDGWMDGRTDRHARAQKMRSSSFAAARCP